MFFLFLYFFKKSVKTAVPDDGNRPGALVLTKLVEWYRFVGGRPFFCKFSQISDNLGNRFPSTFFGEIKPPGPRGEWETVRNRVFRRRFFRKHWYVYEGKGIEGRFKGSQAR